MFTWLMQLVTGCLLLFFTPPLMVGVPIRQTVTAVAVSPYLVPVAGRASLQDSSAPVRAVTGYRDCSRDETCKRRPYIQGCRFVFPRDKMEAACPVRFTIIGSAT